VEGDDPVAGGIAEGGMLQCYQACSGYRTFGLKIILKHYLFELQAVEKNLKRF